MQNINTDLRLSLIDPTVRLSAGAQAQGDLLVLPRPAPPDLAWEEVPRQGVPLLVSHVLLSELGWETVRWAAGDGGQVVAYLMVPPGGCALLVHTKDHAPLGIASGTFVVLRKRQQTFRTPEATVYPRAMRESAWVSD